ncbi:MAG TPA: hypothetical protein VFW65_35420 [Pseudonocardiaceae bacterium]|nr:hypothetical protein [Pseudonocardiaceae bacterium]
MRPIVPDLPDPAGRTPMDMAVAYRHDLAIKLLQAHSERRSDSAQPLPRES